MPEIYNFILQIYGASLRPLIYARAIWDHHIYPSSYINYYRSIPFPRKLCWLYILMRSHMNFISLSKKEIYLRFRCLDSQRSGAGYPLQILLKTIPITNSNPIPPAKALPAKASLLQTPRAAHLYLLLLSSDSPFRLQFLRFPQRIPDAGFCRLDAKKQTNLWEGPVAVDLQKQWLQSYWWLSAAGRKMQNIEI